MILVINIAEINRKIKMNLQGKVNKTYYHMPRALKESADYLRDRMRFLAPTSIGNSIVNLGTSQQNISNWEVNVGMRPTPWKDRPTPMATASPNWKLSNYWIGVFFDQGTGRHREKVGGKRYPRLGKGQNKWSFRIPGSKAWMKNYTGESAHHFREHALQMSVGYIKQTIAEWLKVAWK